MSKQIPRDVWIKDKKESKNENKRYEKGEFVDGGQGIEYFPERTRMTFAVLKYF